MNTISGVNEPYTTLTLDGLNATTTLIEDAVGDYLPISGGTLQSSTGTTRLGIAASTLGTLEYFTTAGVSQASLFYNIGTSELRFNVGTNTNVLRIGGTTITYARNISMGTTNRITNMGAGTSANDAVNYGQTMLRNGANAATADIPMGGFKLTGLANGVAGTDAATVSQIAAYLPLAGGTMTGTISATTVTTPFDFSNPTGTIIAKLSAGSVAVTNACTLQMNSNSASVLDFRDNADVTKAQFRYLYGSPGSLNMLVNAVTALSTTDTLATFGVPLAMSSKKISGLLAGATGTTEAVNVTQMEAADALKLSLLGGTMGGAINMGGFQISNMANGTGSQNAVTYTQTVLRSGANSMTGALDMGTTNKIINLATPTLGTDATTKTYVDTAGTTLTTAYIAADAVVTNNSVQKTGSIMTGTLTINNIQTFLQATHTAASSLLTMQGGSSSVPNSAHIRMTMGLLGGLEFFDYSGALMGYMRYDVQNTPDRIVFNVSGVSSLIVQSAAVICSQPLAMSTKQITGLQTGSANDHAVNKGQMDIADNLRLKLDGTVAMTGQLYMGNFRIGDLSPGLTNLDGVNYQQITESSIPLTAWRSGETIQTVRKSPAFSQSLTNTTCSVITAQVPLVSTSMTVTAGNHIVVTCTFECSSTGGGGDDHFRIVYEYGTTPTTVTWNYNLGAPTNFRNRVCTQEYCFLAPNTGTRTILARLYNDGDDTMTIDNTNWSFVVREIKA